MKLTRLKLEQFKQFRKPVTVDHLQSGINLFVGPNESGKSTLVRAVQAAFFERCKSKSVSDLQPWGDSSATPEIELEFDWQGEHWHLCKRFLGKARCDLTVGVQQYNGEEAEDRLAELLGYQFAGRGASKAEHWGIPGLLWVQQGAVQDIREPVDHAGDHLKSALNSSLGEVTSSGGDELTAQVEAERAKLLTKGGKPAQGPYKAAIEACEKLANKLAELNGNIALYQEQVDRLGRLKEEQQEADERQPWLEMRGKVAGIRVELEQVKALQVEQERERQMLVSCQKSQQIYRHQLQDFDSQTEQLKERTRQREQAHEYVLSLQKSTARLDQLLNDAQTAYQEAENRRQAARRAARYLAVKKELDRISGEGEELKARIERAEVLQGQLDTQREKQQRNAVDEDGVEQLRKVEEQLKTLAIQQKSVATRLSYRLNAGKIISIGDEHLAGEGERLLIESTELVLPDLGSVTIQPGGNDLEDLLRQQQRNESERKELLQRLGVSDLAAAEQRLTTYRELTWDIKQSQQLLQQLAPQGVANLQSECRLLEGQRSALVDQLADFQESVGEVLDEQRAELELESAQVHLKNAEQESRDHKQNVLLAEQASRTAHAEWEKLNAELNSADRQARRKEAEKTLSELFAQEEKLSTSLRNREQQIEAANPSLLEQDIERLTRSAESMEREARQRAEEITRLQGTLEGLGAQGLEEERNNLAQEFERALRRRDELQRRADALDLLFKLLTEKRQVLTRRLQAPLQKHLNHYLKLLFPGALLAVDEDLHPETLTRESLDGTESGEVAFLSYGAREQMGLISRLAYADLLQQAGRPTLIILDDALVHSDTQRLEHMKRILFDAAQRHQILLFSCHPEKWRDLGVTARDIREL